MTKEEMEAQRELAFKIVYFFLGFIALTFTLLYVYYLVDKKEQEKEEREKRNKGVFYGDVSQASFFDFLAGQVDDETYAGNMPSKKTNLVASAHRDSETDFGSNLEDSAVFYQ